MKNIIFLLLFLFISVVSIRAQQTYQLYYGNLHSHTSYSDGVLTPVDAYQYARDSADLDFLAVTDHLHLLDTNEFVHMQNMATQSTVNGSFVAIYGYEWTSNVYGHVNVYNTTEMTPISTYYDWSGFINWLTDRPNAFTQFNHPGRNVAFNNWNNFDYVDEVTDSSFSLIEFQNVQQATDYYELALNKGWHLSPVWNQDNHAADWGNKNNGRAGVWASDLTANSIFEAIRAGRTVATMDKNASVWIEVFGNSMGLTVDRVANIPLEIILHDGDNEAWQHIEIVCSNGIVDSFSATGNIDTIIYLNLIDDKYVFVRAIQADSDYVWSAPIYVTETIMQVNYPEDFKFNIYPNPAAKIFNITFSRLLPENSILKIISMEGKLIREELLNTKYNSNFKIYLPETMQGLFIVEIESQGVKCYSRLSVIR